MIFILKVAKLKIKNFCMCSSLHDVTFSHDESCINYCSGTKIINTYVQWAFPTVIHCVIKQSFYICWFFYTKKPEVNVTKFSSSILLIRLLSFFLEFFKAVIIKFGSLWIFHLTIIHNVNYKGNSKSKRKIVNFNNYRFLSKKFNYIAATT